MFQMIFWSLDIYLSDIIGGEITDKIDRQYQ